MGYDEHDYLEWDKCVELKREIWLYLGKCMWSKHRSVYQDHMKYICNDITKPFKVKILRHEESVRDMHDLYKYLPPPYIKNDSDEVAIWNFCNQEFTLSELRLAIKDRLTKYMQDEWDDHTEDYSYLTN